MGTIDFAAMLTAATTLFSKLITDIGPGLAGIVAAFAGVGYVLNRIRGAG